MTVGMSTIEFVWCILVSVVLPAEQLERVGKNSGLLEGRHWPFGWLTSEGKILLHIQFLTISSSLVLLCNKALANNFLSRSTKELN